jgi:hypothetical protein
MDRDDLWPDLLDDYFRQALNRLATVSMGSPHAPAMELLPPRDRVNLSPGSTDVTGLESSGSGSVITSG